MKIKTLRIITVIIFTTIFFSCNNTLKSENEVTVAADTNSKNDKPEGKQTPAPELGTLNGKESESFYIGANTITTYYPIAFFEDLIRGRADINAEKNTGNPRSIVNQFGLMRKLRGPEFKQIATPNNDTYYAQAFVDISNEPLIFHIPKIEPDRYFVFQLWDPYGDTFKYLGSRTIGNNGGDYAFVGPDYKGELPENLNIVNCPYNNFAIWGRIGALPNENDEQKVHEIEDNLTLMFLGDYKAGNGKSSANQDFTDKRIELSIPEDLPKGLELYYKISKALEHTPPKDLDVVLLESMPKIGYNKEGTIFDYKSLNKAQINGLKKAALYALNLMDVTASTVGINTNGWRWSPKSGIMGNDYLFRAAWAKWYTGGNSAEEAIYMDGRTDDKGNTFDASKRYIVHFDKESLPRVKAFWSISMYHLSDGSFVENEINRYSIGNKTKGLTYNKDGSLDIFIQAESPKELKQKSNWLPTPKEGGFYLNLRLYNPDQSLQNGTWKPPMVKINN